MDLYSRLTPAIMAYEAIAVVEYMAPAVFETRQLEYVQSHFRYCLHFMVP